MPSAVDAILLCGGAGLRLRSVSGNAPKSLTNIGDRPFLELLLSQLRRHGFERAILAVGYRGDAIRQHFGDRALGLNLDYSTEATPLGTGGALRNALDLIHPDTALIMNGDSYTDADLSAFADDYRAARADFSMVVVPADGRVDVGLVSVDPFGKISGFKEKQTSPGSGQVNAGIYITTKRILGEIPAGVRASLEEELFPQWLAEGKHLRAFRHLGECIDIGTPERYRSAQELLANAEVGGSRSGPKRHRA
jgi:NDP-sugar pyrophosphorylase family protein